MSANKRSIEHIHDNSLFAAIRAISGQIFFLNTVNSIRPQIGYIDHRWEQCRHEKVARESRQ